MKKEKEREGRWSMGECLERGVGERRGEEENDNGWIPCTLSDHSEIKLESNRKRDYRT